MTDSIDQLMTIEPEEDVFVFPVSYAQRRLWFLDQFDPGSPFYNIPSAVRLLGTLDEGYLSDALNEIVQRHEALRTTFITMDGEPVQVIHPELLLSIPLIDLTRLPDADRHNEAQRLANHEARQPFDLKTGPLLRVTLLRLSEQEHIALLTMHHIVSDGWSMGVLIYELSTLYEAYTAARGRLIGPSPLPELPIQYADYSEWQRNWLQGEVLEGQINYWLDQLGGLGSKRGKVPVLELPGDRTRPAVLTSRGAYYSTFLPKHLTQALKDLGQAHGATLFMTLIAAFQALVYRYTGQEDFAVGSPIANRARGELEGLIGVFINTIVLRADMQGEPSFRQLLQRVKESTLGAYANQDVPFEVIVEKLQLERDMSHNPLFQVMFILQNAPVRARRLSGMMMEPVEVHSGTSTFDITFSIAEMVDGLNTSVEYNTDIFNQDTIVRMVDHYCMLLTAAVAQPDRPIAEIPLLTEAERQQILFDWNDTADEFIIGDDSSDRRKLCIHELVERQARRFPDSIAVVVPAYSGHPREALSYQELDGRANVLASYLIQQGVGPETLVGICMERSSELIVSLLAVLKAGGAYLPLDPLAPGDRLGFILSDAALLLPGKPLPILTQERLLDRLPVNADQEILGADGRTLPNKERSIICIDRDWPQIAAGGHELQVSSTGGVNPANLVYMTYTSGSTGQSKGVMVEHRSLVNAYLAWEKDYNLAEASLDDAHLTHLQMANFTFDVFSGDLVRALCSGGTLVLCPKEWLLSADHLYQLMLDEGVDIAEFVPAVLRNLAQYLEQRGSEQGLSFMRLIACGSDSWYVNEYRRFLKLCGPTTRLVNSFGLTEATIDSTYFEGSTDHLSPDQLVPIGRPFANTRLYILDQRFQPLPIGVPGELYVAGPGVARGYHNRPDLSLEKFIQNPLGGTYLPGEIDILYRTGDMARYTADGNVEFLGRMDDQLKIRGLRIEPGEIEAAIGSHPTIKEVAVVAVNPRNAPADDKRLVAFLVANPVFEKPTSGDLRRFAQERLPDYMVPSVFVLLENLPLNASGKVDRRALAENPGIDWTQRQIGSEYIPPRTPVEELLADIWGGVLGLQQVGVEDNFFELGGHSLLATQLVSRIRETFQVELPLRNLFESPTIATLAEQIEVAGLANAASPTPALTRLARDPETGLPTEPVPLSFAQQRLWFLDQLEPDSPFYNLPEAVRLTGRLDVHVLDDSLSDIVLRHESLRTTFQVSDGVPVQVIAPALQPDRKASFTVVDLRHLDREASEREALRIAEEEAAQPFNLSTGPLFRGRLLRLAEEDTVILLTMHHIIGDNWSSNVLIQELALLYDAKMNGRPSPLPPLAVQYPDFAAWQRSWLAGDVLAEQVNYWKNQLRLLPPLLELPTDRPRPPVQTFVGDYRTFHLPVDVSRRMHEICQEEEVTLFMALLAAFQVLLLRYTGQEDISVGSPIANRTRAEVEGLIGFFVNTLVLRTDLSGEPSFRQLLRRVRETSLGAYAHQDLPFEMVVDALQPERNLSHSPLFQVMFVLQSAARRGIALPNSGLQLGPMEVHSGTAKFDLTLFMVDEGESLSGAFEFNTDLFDTTTIERMMQHFEVLVSGIAGALDQPVTRLPLLTAAELEQTLIEWNQTQADFPDELCAHQLFEAQVARTPQAVALTYLRPQPDGEWQEENWSYQELNQKSNQLARTLQKLGIGSETLVGLYVERSPELVMGILAVLKAGGAYVPLDPTYPGERLRFMLEDSAAPVLLTQRSLLDRLQAADWDVSTAGNDPLSGIHTICLDSEWEMIAAEADGNLTPSAGPHNLCYVIYTSGSTGKPKGTLIEHRGLVNYLTWCQSAYPLQEGQGSPVHSSISFDLTITSIYTPLISGKRTILLPEGLGVELLGKALQLEASQGQPALSLVKITPAHLQLLGEQLSPHEAHNRTRAFIIGGENLTLEQIRFWQEHSPETQLVNEYGPTETVVGCCVYWAPLESAVGSLHERFRSGIIPIGRPIINTQLYILDRNLQPLPVGAPGELYIGGAGVGRGYLNRPELTAERFISNPVGDYLPEGLASRIPSGDRLYRTGDLARYLPDGNIECLGRIDFQVKIRGFRVELGEIESVLSQHPAVHEAVVWVWEPESTAGTRSHKNLVAYIVPEVNLTGEDDNPVDSTQGQQSLAAELRDHLKQRLPDYMVPAAFVFLQAMPLTINGKVDRKALPAPETAFLEQQPDSVAPRTPQEEIIASIWGEILHLPRIGVYDNFFELGGHSLLATQVISRLRDAFQAELPLRALFESPTVAGLAAQVENFRRQALGLSMPPILPIPRDEQTSLPKEPVPLSYSQQRLWILDQLLPGSPLYNIPAVIRLEGKLSIPALERSLEQIIARHESLRTVFRQVDGLPVQEILPEVKIRLQYFDLQEFAEEEQNARAMQIAMEEALRPFDLANGPLMRIGLLQTEEEAFTILLNTHHIVSDDWSLTIFTREMFLFYTSEVQLEQGEKTGAEPQLNLVDLLPDLTIQYADFAAWQRQWLQGTVLDQQMEYWMKQLTGSAPLLEIPTDRPRPAVQTYAGDQVTFQLLPDVHDGLREIGRKEGATLFMTLLAAFQVMLHRYTGQEDISVGTPIANRTRSELENLIGFFVNTLVMRSRVSGASGFVELLRQVRETALGAYAHQDVPFEMLVDALHPQRDMSHQPLFQVMFVLQNAPRQTSWQLAGAPAATDLQLKPVEMHEGIARFDLTLMMVETPDGLSASLEYNTDLFDRSTIERMAGHFRTLVESILADPRMPIGELPILTPSEKAYILGEWSQTAGEYPQGRLVHQLFEEMAQRQPQEIALVFQGSAAGIDESIRQMSYAELNQRANLLAHFLIKQGVERDTLVGICVEHSLEQIVALLGILKAGGAYLPIDPAYPQERQAFMMDDAGIKLLLTQHSLQEQLPQPDQGARQLILLDRDWDEIAREGDWEKNPDSVVTGQDLAYVIYTSGSTGRPKGVMVQHEGLTNLVYQQILGFGADAHSRILQFASFSFDASVAESLVALLAGGRLVLASKEILSSPPDLLQLMAQQQVNMATLPPSLLRVLDADEVLHSVPSLQTVISAGEACPKETAARWSVGRKFINAYGPTEATVGPTYYVVQARQGADGKTMELVGIPEGAATVPIGRPIANMKVFILDAHRQLAPAGVHGEIYLGGVGLARGYLNRPDLTQDKFVPDPFSDRPGERLYRTGDLARYLPDGNIEFLGRVDHQVKVRGFRIELGEIESLVGQYPLVKTAYVMAREDRPGEKRLVAYLVPEDYQRRDELTPAVLRDFLKNDLPEYMLPSAYVVVEALPLTPNGKVDRRALPAPEQSLLEQAVEYVAPRSDVEETLAAIWQEVLGLPVTEQRPTAGVYDNFFEFGGDSILAIQLVSRANQAGLRLTPRQLFERPTLAQLAEVAEQINLDEAGSMQQPGDHLDGTKVSQEELSDFGWSEGDLQDILGAIGSTFGEQEEQDA